MSERGQAGLSLRNWSIRFDGVRALDKVSLDFPFGTITALLGENGSGKSTLVKILAGIHAAEPGATLEIDGQDVALPRVPADAAALGIGFLHQDLGLLDEASVAENMALAAGYGASRFGWVSRGRLAVRARKALAHIGLQIDVETPVGRLSMRDRTLVAFARTLASGEGGTRRVLVLDEPTASLAAADAAAVYEVIARVAQAGAAIILITHHLEEVVAVAERVAVLQAGRVAAALPAAGLGARDLARLMLDDAQWQEPEGRQSSAIVPSTRTALSIRGLRGVELDGVDFDVHRGEIVGLAGLRGAGLAELVAVLSGETTPKAGRLVVGGREIPVGDRAALLSAQVAVVPEDRRAKGVNLGFSIVDNLALGTGVREREARFRPLQRRREYQQAGGWIARLDIRPAAADRLVGGLSGGNQQKVALARSLTLQPKVLLLDEPTQGVDVGARAVIAREVRHFAATGGAVLLASSNHEELLELSDRIIVLVRGRVVAELADGTLTRASLLQAVGGDSGEATPSGGDHEDHSIIAAVSA